MGIKTLTTAQFDKLCDFVADGIEDMTDAEINAELKVLGIDVEPAVQRIREALDRRMEHCLRPPITNET